MGLYTSVRGSKNGPVHKCQGLYKWACTQVLGVIKMGLYTSARGYKMDLYTRDDFPVHLR